MPNIYLDYAATSPLKKEVFEAMLPYYQEYFGNPSSIHKDGQVAAAAIDRARESLARYFGVMFEEVIFCSGASEALNLAIKGVVFNHLFSKNSSEKPTVVISALEHSAVEQACRLLEESGLIQLKVVPSNVSGQYRVEDFLDALDRKTLLVALVYVQNEIGTVQPIKELARVLKKQEDPPYLLVDAVQAVEYFDCRPESLGADLLVVAPHKFGGPKGVGILFRRLGIALWPLISGGEQEFGLRAGTENVAGVVGAAKAIELVGDGKKRAFRRKRVGEKRQIFEEEIQKRFPSIKILGKEGKRAPHISGLAVRDLNAQQALIRLDMAGLSLSMGSACSSRKMRFSKIPVLLKLPSSYEKGFLRVSFSEDTSEEEIRMALKILSQKLYGERD